MQKSWRLVAASSAIHHGWVSGIVVKVEDLYSQQIFGAAEDLRCECGTVRGAAHVGDICPRCGVRVEFDAKMARRRLIGVMRLASYCQHPIFGHLMFEFPIAPLAFRTDKSGSPNRLGMKYQRLVEVNSRLTHITGGHPELDFAIADLFKDSGSGPNSALHTDSHEDPASLMELLNAAFLRLDPNLGVLVVCCGLALSLSAEI